MDHPNSRSSHITPIPRGGGIAVAIGIAVASTLAAVCDLAVEWTVLAAAAVMASVGFADDRLTLPATTRLLLQVGVGAATASSLGGLPWIITGAVVVPLVVNVVNFMDGINGITSLTLAIWGAATSIAGISYSIPALATLGGITAASALGFLPWNFPNAKLFLGDAGSYLLGTIAAGGILVSMSQSAEASVLTIAPLAIYFADTSLTIAIRIRRGEPITQPHRQHTYQKLVQLGFSHWVTASWAALLAIVITVAASTVAPIAAALITLGAIILYRSMPAILHRLREPRETH